MRAPREPWDTADTLLFVEGLLVAAIIAGLVWLGWGLR